MGRAPTKRVTWVADPPDTPPVSKPRARLCSGCRLGDHHLCTGVGCYGCPPENHPARPGVAGLGQQSFAEHQPGNDATEHKPAHRRGAS